MKKYRTSKKEAAMYKDENGTSPDGPRLSNLTGITGLTGMTKVYHTESRQPLTHTGSRFTMQYFSDASSDDTPGEYDQNRCTRIFNEKMIVFQNIPLTLMHLNHPRNLKTGYINYRLCPEYPLSIMQHDSCVT